MKSWKEKSGVGIYNPKALKQEPEEQSFFLAESLSHDQKPAPSYWFRNKVYNFGKWLSKWAESDIQKQERESLEDDKVFAKMDEVERFYKKGLDKL